MTQIRLLLLGLAAFVGIAQALPSLEEVCANNQKDKSTVWLKVEDVQELIEQFQANRGACDQKFASSFMQLNNLLDDTKLMNDVCGDEMYDAIRKYHETFISVYVPDASKEELKRRLNVGLSPIPKALHDFFIVFVDSITAVCKKDLTERLEKEMNAKITHEEFQMMVNMEDESERLVGSEYYQKPKGISDVIIDPHPVPRDEKLYIQVRFNDILKKAKDACEKKFRPIYDELFVPIIRLNNIGYWDKLETYVDNFKFKWLKRFTRWLGIIQICETLKDIEVIVDSTTESVAADMLLANDKSVQAKEVKKIRVLSKQEAETLQAEIDKKIQEQGISQAIQNSIYQPQQVEMKHSHIKLGSVLITSKPSEIIFLVDKFQKKVNRYMRHRLNPLERLGHKIQFSLKSTMHKWRHELIDKDQDTAVGKVGTFMDKHKAIGGGGALVTAMIFALK